MIVVGKGGEVVEWNGKEKQVTKRWNDEGSVGITTIALSSGGGSGNSSANAAGSADRYLAIGSTSGIVNLYDRRKAPSTTTTTTISSTTQADRPKLLRSFDNLTTPISYLAFSSSSTTPSTQQNRHQQTLSGGQILAISSRWKKDALRLIHLPSASVYKNWPTPQTPLGRITALAWSSTGDGTLVVGNEAGRVRCWEVRG